MENPYELVNATNSTARMIAGLEEYEEPVWQPDSPRDPLIVVVPISVVYATIFVMGVVGNISTCIVIARNKSMHTATNYYLFSLAVSDLLLLILGLPVEIYQVWYKYHYIFGEAFCVLRGLAAETSTNASVLTITAFTAERYIAICHPFFSQTMSKLSRVVKIILVIWLFALVCAVPQAIQVGLISPFPHQPDALVCTLKNTIWENYTFVAASFFFFIVPLMILSVLYAMIGVKLRKSNFIKNYKRQQSHKRTASTKVKVGSAKMDRHCRLHTKSTRRVIKMLVAVVVTFFICWAPFHIQRLIGSLQKQPQQETQESSRMLYMYLISTYVSGVFYYFSTAINPILYNIMSNKFREAFMETLARSCRLSRLKVQRNRRSYSSLSRSQQRPPDHFPSKTTGLSLGTALAQESTDCSGNSLRDEFRQVEYSISDGLPGSICNGNGRQLSSSCRKDVIKAEMDVCDINLSVMSLSCATPPTPRLNGSSLLSTHFINETSRQQSANGEKSFALHSPMPKYSHPCSVSYRGKPAESSNKKWWCLLGWLPGLKSLRTSHAIARTAQDNVVNLDSRQQQQQTPQQAKDYYMQLHTFKAKDESCRPV